MDFVLYLKLVNIKKYKTLRQEVLNFFKLQSASDKNPASHEKELID